MPDPTPEPAALMQNLKRRLLSLAGGFTETWGTPSFGGGIAAQQATYGTHYSSNMRDDLVNSRLTFHKDKPTAAPSSSPPASPKSPVPSNCPKSLAY